MKILCKKDTIGFTEGMVYETSSTCYYSSDVCVKNDNDILISVTWMMSNPEYFEEIKEILPKFKIGDYAVTTAYSTRYIKIFSLEIKKDWETIYNEETIDGGYYTDSLLRKPTQEELSKYFH